MSDLFHWKGTTQGVWFHYPEGHPDWEGARHGPVQHMEVTTIFSVDGVEIRSTRIRSFYCTECGKRS
jgi:hypothetical protein